MTSESKAGSERDEELAATLAKLRDFAKERENFGIQTKVQCLPDPENPRSKGNRTGEAYANGYAECSRHFITEIDKRIAALSSEGQAGEGTNS